MDNFENILVIIKWQRMVFRQCGPAVKENNITANKGRERVKNWVLGIFEKNGIEKEWQEKLSVAKIAG